MYKENILKFLIISDKKASKEARQRKKEFK